MLNKAAFEAGLDKLIDLLRRINHKRHRLMHFLNLNLSKQVLIGNQFPNLYDVQDECITCKERKRLNMLAVIGKGNITYFTKNGREDGYTYDLKPEPGERRRVLSRGPY